MSFCLHSVLARMGTMERRRFGKTNLQISPLGFGAAPIGYLDEEISSVTHLLNSLLDSGLNLIDTAACYPGSEPLVGRAIGHRRDDYVLVTKCGHEVDGTTAREWSADLIAQTVERALKRLRTDRIDVLLLHSCSLATLEQGDVIDALVKARDAGKIRFLGYSGDNEAAAYAAGLGEVSVVQTSVNICDQINIEKVLPKARENDIGVLAKRPIANAAWKEPSEQKGIYQNYARTYRERLLASGLTPAQLGFEGDPLQLWPRIALRFTVSQPGVHTAIVGTTSLENAKANLAAVEEGPLPDEVTGQIRRAFQEAQTNSGQEWTGLT